MSLEDFFKAALGTFLVWIVGYVFGHSTGWHKGFSECSEAHRPKGKGGAK